jgi:hypothetical protein
MAADLPASGGLGAVSHLKMAHRRLTALLDGQDESRRIDDPASCLGARSALVKKSISEQAGRVFAAIIHLEEMIGRRPFQQEIAVNAGFRSKSSANKYIKELESAGWLQRDYLGLSTLRPAD